jgi:DNA-binding NarL/FixJ family response regulator
MGMGDIFREPDFRVVATVTNGEHAASAVLLHQPDVLVLDLRIPGKSALAVVREISDTQLPTRVVLLTGGLDEDEMLEAIRLGVKGIILKQMPASMLAKCVRTVHAGGTWHERHCLGRAMEKLLRRDAGFREVARLLTSREIEILQMALVGLRNKDVAQKLAISTGTVKMHLHNIYEKLNVSGRLELTLYAYDRGII